MLRGIYLNMSSVEHSSLVAVPTTDEKSCNICGEYKYDVFKLMIEIVT